jgi:hypothetical protein
MTVPRENLLRKVVGPGDDRRPRSGMLLAIFFAPWMPALAMVTSPFEGRPRYIAASLGVIVTVLAAIGLGSNRFRNAAALVAALTALTPFVIGMTYIPAAVMVLWGVAMFFLMAGPFGHEPLVSDDGVHWHKPGRSGGSHVPVVS